MSDDDVLGLVLGKLEDVRQRGGYWMARCPAHEDREASLSIARGTKQPVVLKCHANCDRDAILGALGLTLADISAPRDERPAEEWTPRGPAVAVYRYHDENGEPLFDVCRTAAKDFPQRRPDPSARSGWRWNLNGVGRVPYRLPQLLAAVAAGKTVYVAEGEKDVQAIERAGGTATCNPGGAGKWKTAYDRYLAGADVVIVADRDEPGRKHALAVATGLRGVAASVQVVEPLTGKDAADHLQAGHGLDMFTPVSSEPAPRAAEDAGQADTRAPTQASVLVRLALERYELITGDDSRPYAVARNGPAIARPLRGRGGLREQLAKIYSDACRGAVASASAFTDAIAVLEGHASQAEAVPVHLRVAPYGDGIVLDLGTPDGRCVITGPGGWRRESRSPVLFRRTALTMALPDPVRPAAGTPVLEADAGGGVSGTLAPLAALLNTDLTTFRLLVGWLIAALVPGIPHPILALLGEQGTAKSSAARLLNGLIDPSPAPLRSPPRDIRQWAVTAAAGWTVCIDNISSMSDWLSDSLCKAVTGDGIVDRALYTDDDVVVLAFRRVITLTSIDAGELRGDLGERMLPAELERIPDTERRAEEAIAADYEAARPQLLGAVLTLLCDCLAALPSVNLASMPRMADFGRILAALDEVTGWDTLATYEATAADIAETVVESDLFAEAVRELVTAKDSNSEWQGTAAALLGQITPDKTPKWWPRTPRAAGGRLRRTAPSLRRVRVEVTFDRAPGSGARTITIACADTSCELPSHRHDRHGEDADQNADQQELSLGGCDGSEGGQPSHPNPAGTGPAETGSPTVTPSQHADQREHQEATAGCDANDGVTVDPTLNLAGAACDFRGCKEQPARDCGDGTYCQRHAKVMGATWPEEAGQ